MFIISSPNTLNLQTDRGLSADAPFAPPCSSVLRNSASKGRGNPPPPSPPSPPRQRRGGPVRGGIRRLPRLEVRCSLFDVRSFGPLGLSPFDVPLSAVAHRAKEDPSSPHSKTVLQSLGPLLLWSPPALHCSTHLTENRKADPEGRPLRFAIWQERTSSSCGSPGSRSRRTAAPSAHPPRVCSVPEPRRGGTG